MLVSAPDSLYAYSCTAELIPSMQSPDEYIKSIEEQMVRASGYLKEAERRAKLGNASAVHQVDKLQNVVSKLGEAQDCLVVANHHYSHVTPARRARAMPLIEEAENLLVGAWELWFEAVVTDCVGCRDRSKAGMPPILLTIGYKGTWCVTCYERLDMEERRAKAAAKARAKARAEAEAERRAAAKARAKAAAKARAERQKSART